MPQRLFSTGKIGLFLDTYAPGVEKRKGDVVKIITGTFRVQPFDAKLATSIDDGLSDNSGVRAALFKLGHPDPKPHLDRVNFSLACPRQNMIIFASPDTDESRVALLQMKITGIYARTQKDVDGYALVFNASCGPLGRTELEYLHAWHRTQRFVTFEEAEPGLDFEDSDDEGADENAAPARPKPMWDEGDEEKTEPSAGEKKAAAVTEEAKREKGNRYPPKAKKAKKGRK